MVCQRAFLGKLCKGTLFSPPFRAALALFFLRTTLFGLSGLKSNWMACGPPAASHCLWFATLKMAQMDVYETHVSLGAYAIYANFVRFWGAPPLLPRSCPVRVQ